MDFSRAEIFFSFHGLPSQDTVMVQSDMQLVAYLSGEDGLSAGDTTSLF